MRLNAGTGRLGALPYTRAHAREDVAELGASGALVPAAAAAALAAGALVQDQLLAAPVDTEAQPELAAAVGERDGQDRSLGRARHQPAPPGSRILWENIGTQPPGVTAGGVRAPPGHLADAATLALLGATIQRRETAAEVALAALPRPARSLVAEHAPDVLEVEAQPPVRAPEPDRAQLRGVRVDPLAVDPERAPVPIGPRSGLIAGFRDLKRTSSAEVARKSIFSRREIESKSGPRAGTSQNGEGRNRTGDTTIFSRVLYQLSYLAWDGEPCRRDRRW